MGFGTLFIGYFLLLNITYYSMTDVIAAAVMLLGLYKLSGLNKPFKLATYICAGFLAFSVAQFAIEFIGMFITPLTSGILLSACVILRFALVGVLTYVSMMGIREVAAEVELERLPSKCRVRGIAAAVIYAMWIILELPIGFISDLALAIAAVITMISTLVISVLVLTSIYSAYMRICMPGDEVPKDKPSKFKFVNEYRAKKAERAEKEAQERLESYKNKINKKKGKKK